ncbi:MAG: hypothetical protein WC435_03715 [Candidatus Paceibacterota bacterium]
MEKFEKKIIRAKIEGESGEEAEELRDKLRELISQANSDFEKAQTKGDGIKGVESSVRHLVGVDPDSIPLEELRLFKRVKSEEITEENYEDIVRELNEMIEKTAPSDSNVITDDARQAFGSETKNSIKALIASELAKKHVEFLRSEKKAA